MLNQCEKVAPLTMLISYFFMIVGLLLWEWGTIFFLSIFTFGMPIFILMLPIVGVTMELAKSRASLFFRFFCSLLVLIPLTITLTSLPLRTMISENGDYIVTPQGQVIAALIIGSGLVFLFISMYLFLRQYYLIKKYSMNHRCR